MPSTERLRFGREQWLTQQSRFGSKEQCKCHAFVSEEGWTSRWDSSETRCRFLLSQLDKNCAKEPEFVTINPSWHLNLCKGKVGLLLSKQRSNKTVEVTFIFLSEDLLCTFTKYCYTCLGHPAPREKAGRGAGSTGHRQGRKGGSQHRGARAVRFCVCQPCGSSAQSGMCCHNRLIQN